MENKKAVGIWIRVSTEDQARGESPEHHEKRARLYAEAKGWDVKEVYHLEALSGKSVMHYPQTKEMLKDIREKKITGLIFSKLARLARNTKELLEFADIFEVEGADLISLQEAIDTSTPAGRLFYTMIAAMAQWEREEIASRVAASIPIRAKLGKQIGGQPSLGYRWENKEIVIVEKEAPIRKLVYELFLKHKRKKTVARLLNEQGYRTRNGSEFSDSTVVRLLRDPIAKGERRSNYTSHSVGKKWEYKPVSEWVIHACPAIVSEELWNECNRILDEQENKHKALGPRPKHLLAGFVYCTCGKKMYVFHQTLSPAYTCKDCKNRIAAEDLDEIFHEQLKTFLLTDTDVSGYLEKIDASLQEKKKLVEVVEKEKDVLKKKMDNLIDMRSGGEMTKEVFAEHYRPLEERMLQILNQLPELQAEVDFLKIQHLSSDTVVQDAKDLYSHWNSLAFEEKRTIIEIITEKIVVGKEDIYVKLSYLPSKAPKPNNSNNSSNTTLTPTFGTKTKQNTTAQPITGKWQQNYGVLATSNISLRSNFLL
ncbi:MAG TPA: recombinase family protein [Chitinophagales bacterium]|nr:recombinase family protein [Chitinophagales bacterium]